MTDQPLTPPPLGSTPPEMPATLVPPPITDATAGSKHYQSHFFIVYGVLGAILVGALVGFGVLVVKPGAKPTPPWSTWQPAVGTVSQMTSAIADHVSHEYRVSAGGAQLVAIVPSKPTVT